MDEFKTVTMNESKFNNLIRYIEDERAECIERDVEPSEDLKDAYEAISEIFNQIRPVRSDTVYGRPFIPNFDD
tara:strand:- start:713 stop:931 length:219 start_codon:yes stop_codon:yes gene_type:complete